MSNQSGFTLIELMLAIVLGLLLLIGIGKIYLSLKQAYYQQTNIARLQENGRLATHILTNNIQMAGYSGCRSFRFTNSISIKPNSDTIIIKKADTAITRLTQNIDAATNTIHVVANPATKSNPKLLISDCQAAQLFIADNIGSHLIRTETTIQHHYQISDTEIARYTEIAYFIGKTTRTDNRGKPIYALYMVTNAGRRRELIAGIDNMQIKYINSTAIAITLNLTAGDLKKPWKIYIPLKNQLVQS